MQCRLGEDPNKENTCSTRESAGQQKELGADSDRGARSAFQICSMSVQDHGCWPERLLQPLESWQITGCVTYCRGLDGVESKTTSGRAAGPTVNTARVPPYEVNLLMIPSGLR